jgi:acyl-coenzyme A synthetase/AMP-(fatty) acid ligase
MMTPTQRPMGRARHANTAKAPLARSMTGTSKSIDADGYVTYGGRADDMLKVSGKWLSPQELENCLLQHEAVRDAAVVGIKTRDGLVKPSAFVVPKPDVDGTEVLATQLQDWAKARLEPYKYPRDVVFVDELPRTHLGKVDRGKLSRGP